MEPTLVTFSKPWGPYKPGDALYVDADQLAELLAAGVIEPPDAAGDE
jgi:hypothetical protein